MYTKLPHILRRNFNPSYAHDPELTYSNLHTYPKQGTPTYTLIGKQCTPSYTHHPTGQSRAALRALLLHSPGSYAQRPPSCHSYNFKTLIRNKKARCDLYHPLQAFHACTCDKYESVTDDCTPNGLAPTSPTLLCSNLTSNRVYAHLSCQATKITTACT